jgi:hypothetical protein
VKAEGKLIDLPSMDEEDIICFSTPELVKITSQGEQNKTIAKLEGFQYTTFQNPQLSTKLQLVFLHFAGAKKGVSKSS